MMDFSGIPFLDLGLPEDFPKTLPSGEGFLLIDYDDVGHLEEVCAHFTAICKAHSFKKREKQLQHQHATQQESEAADALKTPVDVPENPVHLVSKTSASSSSTHRDTADDVVESSKTRSPSSETALCGDPADSIESPAVADPASADTASDTKKALVLKESLTQSNVASPSPSSSPPCARTLSSKDKGISTTDAGRAAAAPSPVTGFELDNKSPSTQGTASNSNIPDVDTSAEEITPPVASSTAHPVDGINASSLKDIPSLTGINTALTNTIYSPFPRFTNTPPSLDSAVPVSLSRPQSYNISRSASPDLPAALFDITIIHDFSPPESRLFADGTPIQYAASIYGDLDRTVLLSADAAANSFNKVYAAAKSHINTYPIPSEQREDEMGRCRHRGEALMYYLSKAHFRREKERNRSYNEAVEGANACRHSANVARDVVGRMTRQMPAWTFAAVPGGNPMTRVHEGVVRANEEAAERCEREAQKHLWWRDWHAREGERARRLGMGVEWVEEGDEKEEQEGAGGKRKRMDMEPCDSRGKRGRWE